MFGLLLYIATQYLDLPLYCQQTCQLPLRLAACSGLSLIWLERKWHGISRVHWQDELLYFPPLSHNNSGGKQEHCRFQPATSAKRSNKSYSLSVCYCFFSFCWRTSNKEVRLEYVLMNKLCEYEQKRDPQAAFILWTQVGQIWFLSDCDLDRIVWAAQITLHLF